MKRGWWYVIALVTILVIVLVVSNLQIPDLSPSDGRVIDSADSVNNELKMWALQNFGEEKKDVESTRILSLLTSTESGER